MAWYTEMIPIIRVLIVDTDPDDKEFTDERLKQLLVVAARYVVDEMNFPSYTIDIVPPNITPDPTGTTDGGSFTNFVVLKAACLIDRGSLRVAAAINGVEAKCGPAVMKMNRHMEGFAILMAQGYCKAYEEARLQEGFGNADFCKGILSPFINDSFCPEDLRISDRSLGHDEHRI